VKKFSFKFIHVE